MREILILILVTLVFATACKSDNPAPFITERGDLSIGVSKEALEKDCFGFDWCVKLDGARRVVWENDEMSVRHFCLSCSGNTYVNVDYYRYGEAKHAHQCDKFQKACDRVGGLLSSIQEYCTHQPDGCVEYYQEYCSNGDTDEPDGGVVMQEGGVPEVDAGSDSGADAGEDTGTE